tara:strand:+ start:125 stop:460 length:336 start_codon:yes stop_codon:yes gene_type:complete
MHTVLQSEEFKVWFTDLKPKTKEDIYAAVRVLQEIGPSLGRPRVDTIKGSKLKNLKELRVQSGGDPYRIFFAFDRNRVILLLAGGNKRGQKRFYESMVPEAVRIFKTLAGE